MSTGNDAVRGIGTLLMSQFARGIRWIEQCIAQREKEGYTAAADWYRVILSYAYIEVLEGKDRPPFAHLIRNLPYVLFLKFVAPRRIDTI
jgi:hypothetical protein